MVWKTAEGLRVLCARLDFKYLSAIYIDNTED